MKKYFSFYLCSVLASFSLMTQAMDSEEIRPELEALKRIATIAFPSPIYQNDINDVEEKSLNAANAAQNVAIFKVPNDVFLGYIVPYITSSSVTSYRSLLALGTTCHFFYQLSKISSLYLNELCLTERMPHVIPINILRFKTCNTKEGLFKLAALVSVTVEDLCGWFDQNFLQSAFLSCQGGLPQQLEGQSEEELGALYSVLKVALAAIQAEDTNEEQKTHVMKLVQEYTDPFGEGMSLNKLRLLSLNPDRPGNYYKTLEQLFQEKHGYPFRSTDISTSQAREVIARELLMKGRIVADINNNFFVRNPQKRDVAIEIIELCIQYHQLLYPQSLYRAMLVDDSVSLGCPDLVLKVFSWAISLPNIEYTLLDKAIPLIAQYKDIKAEAEKIESYLKQISSNLLLQWEGLSINSKEKAISLLLQAEKWEDVQNAVNNILSQPEEEFLKYSLVSLINKLVEHNQPGEAEKLIHYALNVEHSKFISAIPYILDHFFGYAINIDREKTIALLKTYAESDVFDVNVKLEALKRLAKFAIEGEKDYILSKIHSLKNEEIHDFSDDLCLIYYYLNNWELCHFYYQKMVQELPSNKDQEALHSLQKAGFNIITLEELVTMSPIVFCDMQDKATDI